MASLARHLESLPDGEGDQFLSEIQSRFLSDFVSKQKSSHKEEEEHLNISSFVQSDDATFDQLISQEEFPKGGESAETNSSSVLHLGSVLSTEHDYLLWKNKKVFITVLS